MVKKICPPLNHASLVGAGVPLVQYSYRPRGKKIQDRKGWFAMECTSQTLGGRIAALRKAKGMTQEQLAARVGVSAPAVSKWETDSSCPDIALLCPLARALDTNVDTLLQFEETLSDSEVTLRLNAILGQAMADGTEAGWEAAEQRLDDLLHQYPNCTALLFNATAACDSFQLFFPKAEESRKQKWKSRKRELLQRVRASGSSAYWQAATVGLASLEIAEGDPEQGAALLRELPEPVGDPSFVWVTYYLKKKEPDKALELTQKQLYRAVIQAQTSLATLMSARLLPEEAGRRKACEAYRVLAQTFGLPDLSDGLELELCLEKGDIRQAADCFVRYVRAMRRLAELPDPQLFAPGMANAPGAQRETASREMCRMLFEEVTKDERCRPLWDFPDCVAARDSLCQEL